MSALCVFVFLNCCVRFDGVWTTAWALRVGRCPWADAVRCHDTAVAVAARFVYIDHQHGWSGRMCSHRLLYRFQQRFSSSPFLSVFYQTALSPLPLYYYYGPALPAISLHVCSSSSSSERFLLVIVHAVVPLGRIPSLGTYPTVPSGDF